MFLVALIRFCFRKKDLKVLNFRIVLSQKEPLVATLSETMHAFPENMFLYKA